MVAMLGVSPPATIYVLTPEWWVEGSLCCEGAIEDTRGEMNVIEGRVHCVVREQLKIRREKRMLLSRGFTVLWESNWRYEGRKVCYWVESSLCRERPIEDTRGEKYVIEWRVHCVVRERLKIREEKSMLLSGGFTVSWETDWGYERRKVCYWVDDSLCRERAIKDTRGEKYAIDYQPYPFKNFGVHNTIYAGQF